MKRYKVTLGKGTPRPTVYCSPECNQSFIKKKKADPTLEIWKECPVCRDDFLASRAITTYCSDDCKAIALHNTKKTCQATDCHDPVNYRYRSAVYCTPAHAIADNPGPLGTCAGPGCDNPVKFDPQFCGRPQRFCDQSCREIFMISSQRTPDDISEKEVRKYLRKYPEKKIAGLKWLHHSPDPTRRNSWNKLTPSLQEKLTADGWTPETWKTSEGVISPKVIDHLLYPDRYPELAHVHLLRIEDDPQYQIAIQLGQSVKRFN